MDEKKLIEQAIKEDMDLEKIYPLVALRGKVLFPKTLLNFDVGRPASVAAVNRAAMDGSEIFIETSTGDVIGSVLSEKVFTVETSTGRKSAPNTTSGGICKITTSTGDAIVTIKN